MLGGWRAGRLGGWPGPLDVWGYMGRAGRIGGVTSAWGRAFLMAKSADMAFGNAAEARRYTWERSCDALLGIYNEVLGHA